MGIIVEISEEGYRKCLDFSSEVCKTTKYYSRSNGSSLEKQINDHCTSKIAELAVENYFRSKDLEILKEADFAIYKGSKKSWDSDLIVSGDVKVHVKSQSAVQAAKFSPSWTFQFGGYTNRQDKLFSAAEGVIAFCIVNKRKVEIKHIQFAKDCMLLLKDPAMKHLVGEKKVIYLADLDKQYNMFVL
jgi:hypothetical protein